MAARIRTAGALALAMAAAIAACGGGSSGESPLGGDGADAGDGDGSATANDVTAPDVNPCSSGQAFCGGRCIDVTADDHNCGACGHECTLPDRCGAGACQKPKIEHVVLIVQENHTFDSYFGKYCQAAAGSNPTCTKGRACCEAAPAKEPHGAAPIVLNDDSNFATDRDHDQACEVQQIHAGAMDQFVTGSTGASTCFGVGPDCASPNNFALADQTTASTYWALAEQGALADRWFQPIAGGSSSNDMYFATAHFQFVDNQYLPQGIGSPAHCSSGGCFGGTPTLFSGQPTIADLLLDAGKTFAVYADGLDEAKAAAGTCPSPPSYCPYASCIAHPIACHGCVYDSSDIPFAYFSQFADGPHLKDYTQLVADLTAGTLPTFAYVKARAYRNEHPNVSKISDGVAFVKHTVDAIAASDVSSSTLVLVTWDEGGGFFDHVAPPPGIDDDPASPIHPIPYGTRVPMIALGPYARAGTVSHVTLEHSSVVRFLEYNFLGPVGQLGANDGKVKNIGSLLDPSRTGIPIPED